MSWQDNYGAIPEAEGSFSKVPEGTHLAMITGAQIVEKPDSDPRVEFEYTIYDGDHKGAKLWESKFLNEKGIPFLKKNLRSLGFNDVDNPKKLTGFLSESLNKKVEVYVKHKKGADGKEYVNTYLNGPVNESLETALDFDKDEPLPF